MFKTESSFRIELFMVFLLLPVIFIIDTSLTNKLILFITLFLVPLSETVNSSIERVVDLITLEQNELAGQAKDIGSSIVFISIFIFLVTWFTILFFSN